jgi:hypothetical protein
MKAGGDATSSKFRPNIERSIDIVVFKKLFQSYLDFATLSVKVSSSLAVTNLLHLDYNNNKFISARWLVIEMLPDEAE